MLSWLAFCLWLATKLFLLLGRLLVGRLLLLHSCEWIYASRLVGVCGLIHLVLGWLLAKGGERISLVLLGVTYILLLLHHRERVHLLELSVCLLLLVGERIIAHLLPLHCLGL